ncbi:MAG: DNA integrity scanning diadenylate cyclase DisA [Microthrixaceae bacterium]|nr:DNA integrity scanning diadenylate cyclase DisA [Microthrixaceae bacterium]MCO5312071.1 DNA integrity scanning diadenylate cyclase DisA [Microthrixaceae bacterium]TXI55285.1 MAG: DNA integrity scanning protein DisA [Mycobacterium sp.]HPB44911.1 DNA integrity scanning diadenylate cyclase DisA [Microthrixaceae bacterium]
MAARRSKALLDALAIVAPGQPLREGLDRVVKASMGALIVVGDGPEVLNICSGGFLLDTAFSAQRLSELAKTDGAIILASDASRIARANVHLVPNPNTPTTETGTRHRTAERVARSIGVPVISVSEDMAVLTVYIHDDKHQLEPIPGLLGRCNQALQTLERYKSRLDEVAANLATAEVEDLVTVRDVVAVLQRTEIVVRIAEEIERYLVELGTDGRLVRLQLRELMAGVEDDRRMVLLDYFEPDATWNLEQAMETLSDLEMEELLEPDAVASALHLGVKDAGGSLSPRGYRMVSKVPRLPGDMAETIVGHFGTLDKLMRATVADLCAVDGVDEQWAVTVKDALGRIAESSILDRYT